MSISRAYAQIAPKKNFVVDVDTSGWGANVYLPVDFDTWYAANIGAITKLGNIYVVNNGFDFNDTVNGSNVLGHVLGDSFLQNYNKHTLVDMGKEISIGVVSNPRMLVFRQVALPFEPSMQGTGIVGYVVVENNSSTLTVPVSVYLLPVPKCTFIIFIFMITYTKILSYLFIVFIIIKITT